MEQILDTKKASAMTPATPDKTPVDNIPVKYNCITSTQDNQAGNEGTKGNSPKKQQIDNLPDELLTQPRFFRVGGNDDSGKFNQKRPIDKWNNPDNQKLFKHLQFTDPRQMAGFDIVGHGRAADYLVLDFDHVLNGDGNFKHAEIERWFNCAVSIDTYFEKSFSGDGYHFIFKPADVEFSAMAGGNPSSLYFIDGDTDTKIEIFYKPNGRYFLLTGWTDNPKTPISEDCDIVQHLIAEIEGRKNQSTSITENNFIPHSDPELAIECLKYIPCDGYKIWCDVGMILHHNGNTIEDWDNWSKTDKREGKYIAGECAKKWKSFDKQVGKPLTIGSLIYLAMQNGYKPPKQDFNQSEVDAAAEYLKSFNADNLTRAKLRDTETIQAIAITLECGDSEIANNFIDLAVGMKFGGVNRRDLMSQITAARKNIQKDSAKKKSARRKDKLQQELNELLKSAPSTDRDEKIRKILRQQCDWDFDKLNRPVKIKASQKNIDLIFSTDPMLDKLVGYNEFSGRITFLKSPCWRKINQYCRDWKNIDDAQLRCFLRSNYAELSSQLLIGDTLIKFSQKLAFHPVKQYLESLVWDDTPRAETFFIKFLRVDDTDFARTITRHWLLGAVSRIYYPGCDFQLALVLQGLQGTGKGYALRMLGGQWYVSLASELDDSHAIDDIQLAWICELEEFSAARKAEINAQKAFLSRSVDTYRPPYAATSEQSPRHCVFSISVNDKQFLRDQTGNRRYGILECGLKENEIIEGLTEEYVNQVWAEVMTMFKELFAGGFDDKLLRLPKNINDVAAKTAEKFTVDDGLADEISAFLDIKIPPKAIWCLMTRTDRHKFFETGNFTIYDSDLFQRYGNLPEKFKTVEFQNSYTDALKKVALVSDSPLESSFEEEQEEARERAKANQIHYLRFYGTELRQHISAGEVFNECFGTSDRRKNMTRINEVLEKLPNWKAGKRLQQVDLYYKDQKKVFYRVDDETQRD